MATRKKTTRAGKTAKLKLLYVDRFEIRLREGERGKLEAARKKAKAPSLAAYIRKRLGLAA